MDCNFNIVSHNELGNVMHCEDCNMLIIGLGTVIVKFEVEQAKIFRKALNHAQNRVLKGDYGNEKIFLKTPVSNLMIALNQRELSMAVELVEFALLRLEIDQLITTP